MLFKYFLIVSVYTHKVPTEVKPYLESLSNSSRDILNNPVANFLSPPSLIRPFFSSQIHPSLAQKTHSVPQSMATLHSQTPHFAHQSPAQSPLAVWPTL